ncbi:MAG: hypothetical protein AAF802_13575 [Planctomycetota bacterium]
MNLEEFTQHVLSLLQQEFPERGFQLADELGVITDGTATFGMTNLFAQYQQAHLSEEDFTKAVIDKFGSAIKLIDGIDSPIPETWAEAEQRLRVQLVSSRVATHGRAITFPFADDVYSSLVVDCESGYAYIGSEDLERWGQSAIDAIEIGKRNVVLSRPSLPMAVLPGESPLVSIQTGDGYDAARVLIEAIRARMIEELTGDADGEVYAAVPNRDFLIAWPMGLDAEVHEKLRDTVAKDARSQSHPLCERVLRITRHTIDLAS